MTNTFDDVPPYGEEERPRGPKRKIAGAPCTYCGVELRKGERRVGLCNTLRFVSSEGNPSFLTNHIVRLDRNPHKKGNYWRLIWHAACFGEWMIDRLEQQPSIHHHEVDYHIRP